MESKELNLNKECNAGGVGGAEAGAGDGFIDRSKVRILLCDNDIKSCEEVFSLLLECSYQVIPVRSARQVIDALNAEGPEIDIILAEVDLPMTKGMKMLKYIMRDKELRRIPVIMMSAQDEASIVVKCLRLGAADYHLGLAEKNILNYDIDLVVSDPSDANTNSMILFSDDIDDKSQKSTNQEMGVSTHQEDEFAAATVEPSQTDSSEYHPDVPGISDRRTGQFLSGPKKSELKIGESSAFFTYVKSSAVEKSTQVATPNDENAAQSKIIEENLQQSGQQVVNDTQVHENGEAWENYSPGDDFPSSGSIPDSLSVERSSTPPVSMEFSQQWNFKEDKFSQVLVPPRNEPQHDVSGFPTQSAYPYYMSGVLNQVMVPSSAQLFQNNLHDLQYHASSAMLPQYNHLQQCLSHPHVSGMASFPYYQVNMCVQPGQMPTGHSWSSFGNSSSGEVKLSKVNGVTVDLNGQPASADYDEDEEEEEQASRDSSPEDDISG
ncbi:hypothetical protein CRYUN_Cryun19dG0033200 [Craigia yunnanensis]